MTLLAGINKLKNTVLHTHDLGQAWKAFLDLAAHSSFRRQASFHRLENMEFILEQICRQMMLAGMGRLRTSPVARCQGTDFYHGALDVDGKPGAFIYFDDAGVGMAALVIYGTKTEFCRFTTSVMQGPWNLAIRHGGRGEAPS